MTFHRAKLKKMLSSLKKALTGDVVLKNPDFSATKGERPFIMETDASRSGTDDALSQADDSGRIRFFICLEKM